LIGGGIVLIQVGDKVRVRRLKDLACEYIDIEMYDGVEMFGNEGVLIEKGSSFVDAMYEYCGEEHKIINLFLTDGSYDVFYIDAAGGFNFNAYMLERLDGSLIAEN
jgi:hypothetical protein